MSLEDSILHLVDLLENEENRLDTWIPAAERERSGNLESWAPKEALAHSAGWTMRRVANMRRILGGEQPVAYGDYLSLNHQDFLIYRELSWEQSRQRSREARQAVREMLNDISETQLLERDFPPSDDRRPLWKRITGSAVEHPLIHLSMVLNAIGQPKASADLQESLARALRDLDPQDREWQGTVQYNLACHYALTGQKSRALEILREALALAPELIDWSKKDSDLDALRGEAEYQELLTKSSSPGTSSRP